MSRSLVRHDRRHWRLRQEIFCLCPRTASPQPSHYTNWAIPPPRRVKYRTLILKWSIYSHISFPKRKETCTRNHPRARACVYVCHLNFELLIDFNKLCYKRCDHPKAESFSFLTTSNSNMAQEGIRELRKRLTAFCCVLLKTFIASARGLGYSVTVPCCHSS
jgi:hypothetical protein